MYHYRKTRQRYVTYLNPKMCPFCDPKNVEKKVVDYPHFYIMKNATQYDHWELHDVTEHLLLNPKNHHETLNTFSDVEKKEMVNIIAEYEQKGYSVYARAYGSPRRSVRHQHTHLIKIKRRQARIAVFLRKPYWLFKI